MAEEKIYGIKSNKCMIDITAALQDKSITSADGVEITFNAVSSHIPVTIEGASRQNRTDGAQIFNYQNHNFSHNTAGTVSLEASAEKIKVTAQTAGQFRYSVFMLGAASYFAGKSLTISVGNITGSSDNTQPAIKIYGMSNDGNITEQIGAKLSETGHITIDIPQNFSNNTSKIALVLYSHEENSAVVGEYCEFEKIMVNEGAAALEYEPYTGLKPSPNVDYPQGIRSVGDSGYIALSCVCGDQEHVLNIPVREPLFSINGKADCITRNASGRWGVLRQFGKVTYDGSDDEKWVVVKLPDETDIYRLRANTKLPNVKIVSGTVKSNLLCNLFTSESDVNIQRKKDGACISTNESLYVYNEKFNTADVEIWKTFLSSNNMTLVYELKDQAWEPFGIEVQNAINEFYSFTGQNILTTTKESACKVTLHTAGTVADVFDTQGGQFGVSRKVEKAIFDGSEDEEWKNEIQSSLYHVYSAKIRSLVKSPLNNDTVANISNTFYEVKTRNGITLNHETGIAISQTGMLNIYDPDYNTSDITLWTEHLKSNPLTVYYELKTPVFEPVSDFMFPMISINYATSQYGAWLLNAVAGNVGTGGGGNKNNTNAIWQIWASSQRGSKYAKVATITFGEEPFLRVFLVSGLQSTYRYYFMFAVYWMRGWPRPYSTIFYDNQYFSSDKIYLAYNNGKSVDLYILPKYTSDTFMQFTEIANDGKSEIVYESAGVFKSLSELTEGYVVAAQAGTVANPVGNLTALKTKAKGNAVDAINELKNGLTGISELQFVQEIKPSSLPNGISYPWDSNEKCSEIIVVVKGTADNYYTCTVPTEILNNERKTFYTTADLTNSKYSGAKLELYKQYDRTASVRINEFYENGVSISTGMTMRVYFRLEKTG